MSKLILRSPSATVPVPPGGERGGSRLSAGLHKQQAAAAGAEGRRHPSGPGGGHQTGAAAHSSTGPAGLPGLPAPLHAHPQVCDLQPAQRLQPPLSAAMAVLCLVGFDLRGLPYNAAATCLAKTAQDYQRRLNQSK